MELAEVFFILLQKLFLFFLRKSNFRTPDIQISLWHQMPEHKTNTFD